VFAGVNYLLTQQEYDELVVEEIVSRRFATGWDAVIIPFRVLIFHIHALRKGKSYAKQLSEFT